SFVSVGHVGFLHFGVADLRGVVNSVIERTKCREYVKRNVERMATLVWEEVVNVLLLNSSAK
ncbi:hypothetical protein KAS10_01195, partial [Candidatus Aerophobetes bacterium]|nr:hypothetical protein [Candidatus Aerophobetes bacterium]